MSNNQTEHPTNRPKKDRPQVPLLGRILSTLFLLIGAVGAYLALAN